MTSVTLVDVGGIDEFPEGYFKIVPVRSMEIGVLRWQQEWFALRNVCPHHAAPLCEGMVQPYLIETDAGEVGVDMDRPVISCAWHRWEFDVRTGEFVVDPKYRAKTYPVTVEAGRVLVGVPATRRDATPSTLT